MCSLVLAILAEPVAWGTMDSDPAAAQRLDRLVRAARTFNYDATFVYHHDGKMDEMRIIHRYANGEERERLVTLSGSTREVLRDQAKVTCIIPDDQTVVVGKSRPQSVYGTPVLTASGYREHYRLTLLGAARTAGRSAEIISIEPRDLFRYGYRLWLDEQTGLLLRSELRDPAGKILESVVYTNLATPETIPDSLLRPEISGNGFSWYTTLDSMELPKRSSKWAPGWLPKGFSMREREETPLPSGKMPLEHLVYGDGLASLSIYVEQLPKSAPALIGASRMGAVNAFGAMIGEFQLTVVGEVPLETVRKVAQSIDYRG